MFQEDSWARPITDSLADPLLPTPRWGEGVTDWFLQNDWFWPKPGGGEGLAKKLPRWPVPKRQNILLGHFLHIYRLFPPDPDLSVSDPRPGWGCN